MAFTTVFVLLVIREQTLGVLSLALLGFGVSLTGFFPTVYGLYFTTVLMSVGFHYLEAVKQSLALQWLSRDEAPRVLGKLISVGAITSLVTYGALWTSLEVLGLDYAWNFLVAGGVCVGLAVAMWIAFPRFGVAVPQRKRIILRKRYWLYYALTFLSGARRQIFIVFAAFLMVEKFGYSAAQVTLLFLVNYAFNWLFAEKIGAVIHRIGERAALTIEYAGLVVVFSAYAFVSDPYVAAGLYIVDHMFFALYIALTTYFHKIADPGDLASSARRFVHHQPHRRRDTAGGTRAPLGGFAFARVSHRRGLCGLLAVAVAQRAEKPRARQRSRGRQGGRAGRWRSGWIKVYPWRRGVFPGPGD